MLASIQLVTILLRAKFCGGGADEFGESGVADVADPETQQEPVPKRFEFISLRHLVARAEERDQRDLHLQIAVVEDPLIGDLQQRVQDRAARLENFVEEDEFGLDKFSGRDPPILVAFQSSDRHRPEQFFRRREASHKICEVSQSRAILRADSVGKFGSESRLCRARWPENNQVLPREQCDQRSANDFIALDQRYRQFALNGDRKSTRLNSSHLGISYA